VPTTDPRRVRGPGLYVAVVSGPPVTGDADRTGAGHVSAVDTPVRPDVVSAVTVFGDGRFRD